MRETFDDKCADRAVVRVAGGSVGARGQFTVAIDLSDLSDEQIEPIDLIRIRKNVSLRYVARSHSLVLHIE